MPNEEQSHQSVLKFIGGLVPKGILKSVQDRAVQGVGHLIGAKLPTILAQSQSARDDREARSTFRRGLVTAATAKASESPELVDRMLDRLVQEEFGKQENREAVGILALEHLSENADAGSSDTDKLLDTDWLNIFSSHAEKATSERLQDLFGRILAGEVRRPGSFSMSTLRTISELDQDIANDFSVAWKASVGSAVDYSPDWRRGDGFSRWKRLAEAGLMATSTSSQFLPDFVPTLEGCALWGPMGTDSIQVLILFERGCPAHWAHIDFTRVGREIGSLLPKPDYTENMRTAALRLPTQGFTKIFLVSGSGSETIWQR